MSGSSTAATTRCIDVLRTHCCSPVMHCTNSASVATATTSFRVAMRASCSHCRDTTTARSVIDATSGTMPATLRNVPSSPSSATKAKCAIASAGMTSCTTSKPTAIAASRPAPPLRSCTAVAKFTVMRLLGHGRSHDNKAARTRSRDSRHASSGWPTIVKPGNPMPT